MLRFFTDPADMEPLLPEDPDGGLAALGWEIVRRAERLGAALHPLTALGLARLVRVVNSYYTHLIEGHGTKPADLVLDSDFNNGDHAGDTQVAMTAVGVPTGAEIWFQNQDGSVTIAVAPQRVTSDPFTVSTFVTLEANYSVKMQTFLRLNGTVLPSTWNLKFEALAISSDVPEAQRPKPITVVNGGPHKGTLLGRVTVKD